jgi:hypothetical protein
MTPAEVLEQVRTSRAAQGLPPTVADPAALDRIAALLVSATKQGGHRDPA